MPDVMSCETKITTLARLDPTLQPLLSGTGAQPYRWFEIQRVEGQITVGQCVVMRRISTVNYYAQSGQLATEVIRFQLNCCALQDPEAARALATAVTNFMLSINCMVTDQFTSPPTTPRQRPNRQLGQRPAMEVETGIPVQIQLVDFKVWNNANF
jgi:hypothetical protein